MESPRSFLGVVISSSYFSPAFSMEIRTALLFCAAPSSVSADSICAATAAGALLRLSAACRESLYQPAFSCALSGSVSPVSSLSTCIPASDSLRINSSIGAVSIWKPLLKSFKLALTVIESRTSSRYLLACSLSALMPASCRGSLLL